MATGVIQSDGTIRTKGAPEGAPWRCKCGGTQVWRFNEARDPGRTVRSSDDAPCCGDRTCFDVLQPVRRPRPKRQEGAKPSNPKDLIGSNKVPLHLWPHTATALGSIALLEGALKYGRTNYRAVGVRASIYMDALLRHVIAWFEGEDVAPDSEIDHIGHALACLAIIADARAAGKLTDDRQIRGGYRGLIDALEPHVARLKEKYADKNPKHYTIADNG